MPLGFCNPPVCWNLTFNFAQAGLIIIKPNKVPKWDADPKAWNNVGQKAPLGTHPALENAFINKLNADARKICDTDCVCVRLHKRAVTVRYTPQLIGDNGLAGQARREIYMENIWATGTFGMCLPKKGPIRIEKDGKWVYPEELPATDLLPNDEPPSSGGSGGSGGHKKKKGKKGKKGKTRR